MTTTSPLGLVLESHRRTVVFLLIPLLLWSPAPPPADPAAALEREIAAAERALHEGEPQLAESRYRAALFEGWMLLGRLAAADGDLGAADLAYGRAAAATVDETRGLVARATVRLDAGRFAEAIADLRRVTSRDADDLHARQLLARALMATGRADEAVAELELAERIAPEDPELAFAIATGFLRAERLDPARRLFDGVAQQRPIPQTWVLIGRTLRDFGHYQPAREALGKALELDPQARRAHYYLGTVELLAEGRARLDQAAEHFELELRRAPDDELASLYLGMTEVEARRHQRALAPLLVAAAGDPPPADAFHYLGRAYLGLDRTAEAVAALRRALELAQAEDAGARQLQSIHYQLALALRAEDRREQAERHFATAQRLAAELTERDRESLQAYLDDTVRREPAATDLRLAVEPALAETTPERRAELRDRATLGLARACFNLAVPLLQGGRPARAVPLLEQAAELRPDFPDLTRTLGIAYYNSQRWAEAAETLEQARAQQPDDDLLRRMLALSRLELEEYARTVELLEQDPALGSDPALLYAFGLALVRSDRTQRAQSIFAQLLAEHRDWAELHVLIGQAHLQEGDWEAAVRSLERALELRADVPDAHGSLGLVHLRRGELAAAEEELRAELTTHPDDVRATFHLATVLHLSGDLEEAEALLRRLLSRHRDHANGRYLLGKILLERGAVEAAVAQLETAAALAPEEPNVHYQLGLAYQRAGRGDRAAAQFERYQELKRGRRGGPP
ncbi:MAG TPA: tetratricopeptide repeat protein [Thermoanaerobaculia bacterium]|nr:tetratricopeptide repeat protein [Thermoanaerobaculia bacterium]